MSKRSINKSALLKTSAASDAVCGGRNITIVGLRSVSKRDILSIKQVNYRAQVLQVRTVAATDFTVVADVFYAVTIYDPNRIGQGTQEGMKTYGFKALNPVTLMGATNALQKEYITGKIVAKINNDGSNKAVAATAGSGNGFTVTDEGPYYPTRSQSMSNVLGANIVLPKTNSDGTGYAATNVVTTTAAVAPFGVGATLAAQAPVMDAIFGNLISGIETPPVTTTGTYADSGQKYNAFVIKSIQREAVPTATDHQGYVEREDVVYVDNGAGSSVTNLAGYNAFEHRMHRFMAEVYSTDQNAICEFFDKGYTMQANPGITPYTGTIATTADVMKFFNTPYGTALEQYNIGTHTIFAPLQTDTGLAIEQDVTAGEGAHYCAKTNTGCPSSFIVGKQGFSIYARVVAGDWTDAFFMIGVRKKAVYDPDYTTYDDLAGIGTQLSAAGDFVATQGALNNATTKETVSAVVIAADAVSVFLALKVDRAGAVTCTRDGVSFPIYSVGTTALILDAGDEMIPFFQYKNLNSSPSTLTFSEFIAVADEGEMIS